MGCDGWLAWLPLTAALLLPFTFLTTYVWSVLEGHVIPDFPYISLTGTYPPESCFFGQMLNIVALLMGLTVWARHLMIVDYCFKNVTKLSLPYRSKVSAFFGFAASAGVSIVGNFQATNSAFIHVSGAFLAFVIGNVYMWIQSQLSYSLEPRVNSRGVSHLRFATALVATIMNVVIVVFSFLHAQANNNEVVYWSTDQDWEIYQQHRDYYLVAAISEWVLASTFTVHLLTFVPEFKRVSVQGIVMELNRDRSQVRETPPDAAESSETIVEEVRL